MARIYNQYSVVAGSCASNEAKHMDPQVCISGFTDLAAAVETMNRWLDETADNANKKLDPLNPIQQADKLFVEHGMLNPNPELMPTEGYLFFLDKGARENYMQCSVINAVIMEPGMNLPKMPIDE